MAVVRQIFAIALLVTGLGLILEFTVPASARIIDIGALVFGVATWIVPPLLLALSNKKRSSLQSVGFTIYLFVVAVLLSVIGLSLALLTLFFAQHADRAWLALLTIAAFWILLAIMLLIGDYRSRRAREVSK